MRKSSVVVKVFNVVIVVIVGEGLRGEGGGFLPVPPRLAHLLYEDVDDGLDRQRTKDGSGQSVSRMRVHSQHLNPLDANVQLLSGCRIYMG